MTVYAPGSYFMSPQYKPPSVRDTSFSCPHCGTLAHQSWYRLGCREMDKDDVPNVWTKDSLEQHLSSIGKEHGSLEMVKQAEKIILPLAEGYIDVYKDEEFYCTHSILNLWLSKCYSCDKFAVWIHDRIVFPPDVTSAPEPNHDLPDDVLRDYTEAASIVNASPRGAAALLRLCVQKLCDTLGQKGKIIDSAISNLVKGGLDPRIQKSLDVVRVVGNNAVHPGKMDLKDDTATALRLFTLVNLVAEKMITIPKHVDDFYETLPQSARNRIIERDKKPE